MVELCISELGSKHWFQNEFYHRANGPAIQWSGGMLHWYWYGQPVTEYEHMILAGQEQVNG